MNLSRETSRLTSVPNGYATFIPDGGVTGKLFRSIDWSKTSLGAPSYWPECLKVALGILFQSRQPMFLFWGPEHISFYNDAYLPSIVNGKHPRAMGKRGREVWSEIWETIEPQIDHVMNGGEATWHENQLLPIYRNGRLEESYWTYSYSAVRDGMGTIYGALVVCTETTEQVKSRTEAINARKAAERARQELYGAFMQAPFPMCVLSGPDYRFTLLNPKFQELIKRDARGLPVSEVFNQAELKLYLPILDRVYQTGEPVVLNESPLLLQNTKGKVEERFIDASYFATRDESGKPDGILITIQDVTIPVTARNRMEKLTQELQNAIQGRDEFLSIASHELRTPLTSMKLQTQVMRRSLNRKDPTALSFERVSKLADQVDGGLNRINRLVDDMLDISRIQGGRLQLRKEKLNLSRLVQDALARFQYEFAGAKMLVSVDADENVPVCADLFRIDQVLTNLATNAIRYAPGAPLHVSVTKKAGRAFIRFEDSGPGIALTNHERIFQRFERLVSKNEISGMGLGLFIVREMIQAHGGTIHVEDRVPHGAIFVIELPLDESPSSP